MVAQRSATPFWLIACLKNNNKRLIEPTWHHVASCLNIMKKQGQISPAYLLLYLKDILVLILETKNSQQSARQRGGLVLCSTAVFLITSATPAYSALSSRPGLRPSSKLLFGDKSILQSEADGHLARCNRRSSPLSPCDDLVWQMLNRIRPAD